MLRVWSNVANTMNEPERTEGKAREWIAAGWEHRAMAVSGMGDAEELRLRGANTAAHQWLEQAGVERGAVEGAATTLETKALDTGSVRAQLYATEQALRVRGNQAPSLKLLWLRASALEQQGMIHRAVRCWEDADRAEREGPQAGTAGKSAGLSWQRRYSLLWRSGEPGLMEEALRAMNRRESIDNRKGTVRERRERRKMREIIDQIRTAVDECERSLVAAGANRTKREWAKIALAEAFLNARLADKALSIALEEGQSGKTESALALIEGKAREVAEAPAGLIRRAYDRALRADMRNARAWLGRGIGLDEDDRVQEGAVCVTRALWLDRRERSLRDEERSSGCGVLARAGRNRQVGRIDAELIATGAARTSLAIAGDVAERAVGGSLGVARGLDTALDAIAINGYGLALMCAIIADACREHATKVSATPDTASAERIRGWVRTLRRGAPTRDAEERKGLGKAIERAIRAESRITRRCAARVPEPLSDAVRALEIVRRRRIAQANQDVEAGMLLRVAVLTDEWALRASTKTDHLEKQTRRMLGETRARNSERANDEWAAPLRDGGKG